MFWIVCVFRRQSKARRLRDRSIRSGSLTASAIGGTGAAARIRVGGGQHAEQGRTAAGTTRVRPAAHTRHGSGPLKPFMQRCVFLRFHFVHRTKPPRVETRPKQQVHAPPFHWSERNPNSARKAVPGIVDNTTRRKNRLLYRQIISRYAGMVEPGSRMPAQVSD